MFVYWAIVVGYAGGGRALPPALNKLTEAQQDELEQLARCPR
jgi:hypothetical protein